MGIHRLFFYFFFNLMLYTYIYVLFVLGLGLGDNLFLPFIVLSLVRSYLKIVTVGHPN